jgi:hypothetical protein
VDWSTAICRRGFIAGVAIFATTGCRVLPALPVALTTKKAVAADPQDTVRTYFALLSQGRADDARGLLAPDLQQRLGSAAVDSLLHSVTRAQVTDVVDAIQWVNQLGAHLPSAPSDRREYLVTLQVEPSPNSPTWAAGTNRRFIDLLKTDDRWLIDGIDITPGQLITGRTPGTESQGPIMTIPIATLRLGAAPVDQVIFAARQRAADRGDASWAINPVEVTRRDGPSFGIDPRFSLRLDGEDRDPVSLASRALVRVARDPEPLLVTLEQPIRTGAGGVWAIESISLAPPDAGPA